MSLHDAHIRTSYCIAAMILLLEQFWHNSEAFLHVEFLKSSLTMFVLQTTMQLFFFDFWSVFAVLFILRWLSQIFRSTNTFSAAVIYCQIVLITYCSSYLKNRSTKRNLLQIFICEQIVWGLFQANRGLCKRLRRLLCNSSSALFEPNLYFVTRCAVMLITCTSIYAAFLLLSTAHTILELCSCKVFALSTALPNPSDWKCSVAWLLLLCLGLEHALSMSCLRKTWSIEQLIDSFRRG